MILRAKTKNLFEGKELSEQQKMNSVLNLQEIDKNESVFVQQCVNG